MSALRSLARKAKRRVLDAVNPGRKSNAELDFWQKEIIRYQQWYLGELQLLYHTPCPREEQKVTAPNLKDASVLTWHRWHQEAKYLKDLELQPNAFAGMKVLDLGSGPMPSSTCFKDCQLYCLDPLIPEYVKAGFPLHYYDNVHFVHGSSENMPFFDGFFDAVISVNSLDHVDDIQKTSREIGRVLKPGGFLRMHVHYHPATITEPLEFNDARIESLFSWCKTLKKAGSYSKNFSSGLPDDEKFVLWSSL